MLKTYKKKGGKSKGTRKSRAVSDQSLSAFQKEITVKFFETLIMIKLFHWKTTSYPTHKATDKLYTKLNANIDSFIEVLLGKSGVRTDLLDTKNMRLIDLQSVDDLKIEVV